MNLRVPARDLRTTKQQRVVVYDPDWVNPYGREVAGTLRDGNADVLLYQAFNVSWVPHDIRSRLVLAGARNMEPLPRVVARRFLGCLAAVASTVAGGGLLVVTDTRDGWDSIVFACAAFAGVDVVAVDHNPVAARTRAGFTGRAERLLKRHATVTVAHSEDLAARARARGNRRVSVAPHPAFVEWSTRFFQSGRRPRTGALDRVPNVLFLGSIRGDKGFENLPAVFAQRKDKRSLCLLFAGHGEVKSGIQREFAEANVVVRRCNTTAEATDEEVASALRDADVLIAPYHAATQSSTVVLAITCGLPVLAYAAGALPDLLVDRSLAAVQDTAALADRLDAFLRDPWPTNRISAEELQRQHRAAWWGILADLDSLDARNRRSLRV